MYLEHYNLTEKPFQITTDPKFLWLGEKHQEALAMLKYGVLSGKGFLLLTGDVGTGKTTLINSLLKSLHDDVIVATVPDPSLETLEFFDYLRTAFRIEGAPVNKSDFLRAFEGFLNDAHSNGKKVLLIVDEAQRLSKDLLEEIRLLSNIEKEDSKLLNVFFVGQDEFKDTIKADECRALRQRIAMTYQINPLLKNETAEYIEHRLNIAGSDEEVFSRGAVEEIFEFSQGYPRLINIVCDHALLTGYVRDLKRLDAAVILECSRELAIHSETKRTAPEVVPHQAKQRSGTWARVGLYALLLLAVGFCGYVILAVGYDDALRKVRSFYGRLVTSHDPVKVERGVGTTEALVTERQAAEPSISPVNRPTSEERETQDQLASVGRDGRESLVSPARQGGPAGPETADIEPTAEPVISAAKPLESERHEGSMQPFPGGKDEEPSSASSEEPMDHGEPETAGAEPLAGLVDSEVSPLKSEAGDDPVQSGVGGPNIEKTANSSEKPTDIDRVPAAGMEPSDVSAIISREDVQEPVASDQAQETVSTSEKMVVPFGFGRARIQQRSFDSLDRLAALMNENPDTEVVVKGYTDSLGDSVSNQTLGQLRAAAVERYLVGKGISPSRIEALGVGQQDPIAPNATREGRSANRRVEIEFVGGGRKQNAPIER